MKRPASRTWSCIKNWLERNIIKRIRAIALAGKNLLIESVMNNIGFAQAARAG